MCTTRMQICTIYCHGQVAKIKDVTISQSQQAWQAREPTHTGQEHPWSN